MVVAGDTNGRWSTIVTISAGSRRWEDEVRLHWRQMRLLRRTPLRLLPWFQPKKLTKLSMIGFARWSLFDRIPTGGPKQQAIPLARPFLLFETNYNGDRDHYFESFSYVVPNAMNRVWLKAYGVPDARRVSEWQRHVKDNMLPIECYYSAYPDASTKTIRSALELDNMLADFRPRAGSMTAERFAAEFAALLGRVQRINDPKTRTRGRTGSLTTLIPVAECRRQELRQALQSLTEPPSPVPAATHFARWCVVDRLKMPSRYGSDPTSYLLFSAWFDGEAQDYAGALHERMGAERAEAIWAHCGFGGGGPESFSDYLMKHRVEAGSDFSGYEGVSVSEVHAALAQWESFHSFASHSQSPALNAANLLTTWTNEPLLGQAT